jgi:hypothetical protein
MAALQDFHEGSPASPGQFQALVDAIENLGDQLARVIWKRSFNNNGDGNKDTANGDSIHLLAMSHSRNISVAPGATDVNIDIVFPISFSKPPTILAIPQAPTPLMISVSSVDKNGCTLNVRNPGASGAASVNITGVHYIAIGPKGQPS